MEVDGHYERVAILDAGAQYGKVGVREKHLFSSFKMFFLAWTEIIAIKYIIKKINVLTWLNGMVSRDTKVLSLLVFSHIALN